MIDLRSDTVTLPSDKMKDFILKSPLGDDVYGEDPSINTLQEMAADIFKKEAALFVPSGTMANLISVLTHCNRGDEILLGDKSHIFYYEAGGVSAFGGIHSHQLINNDDGTIDTIYEESISVVGEDYEKLLYNWLESILLKSCIDQVLFKSFHVKISENIVLYLSSI